LERFLDKSFVDRYMESGEELPLGGTRTWLNVLFADIRGFSRFAQDNDPEEVVRIVNEYLNEMAREVLHNHGLLDKFLGDGMLALFGVPHSSEKDAENAVRAAVGMQAAADKISQRLVREGRQALYLGISLHYGEAIFGLMGSVERPDMTA